jgi:Zn-dependent protease
MIFLAANGSSLSRFLIGWAKPVPVNPFNLRNPRVDDILVTLAGPWMNLLLAIVILGLGRLGVLAHSSSLAEICIQMARLSLLLCFFNLLPIPPLDGSQVVRSLIGMSYETYYQFAQFGFVLLIIVWQFPPVRSTINSATDQTLGMIANLFGMQIGYS